MPDIVSTGFRDGPVVLVSRRIEFTFVLSYAYLAGYLRQMGEDVRILFRPKQQYLADFVKEIMRMNPLLVGFGSLYPDLSEIRQLIRMLDDAGRKFPVVIGGQMVTPIPKFAVGITGADFGVLGEGEITLASLVKTLRDGDDPKEVKGLVIRRGDGFIFTGEGEFIEDLNTLPAVPYDLFPVEDWLTIGRYYARYCPHPHWRFNDRIINVHTGRGCPFTCNFCYHHSKPRLRRIDVAMAEAAEALEYFNANMLYFSDETTLISSERTRQITEGIRSLPRKVAYSVSCRFDILDRIDDNLLTELKNTGCRIMGLGIESGSNRILRTIGKNITAQIAQRGLKRLKDTGILPTVSIMVGQHTETAEDVEASVALMKESVRYDRNIQYALTVTTPFPGSDLYKIIFKNGYLRNDKEFYDLYFSGGPGMFKYVVNLSDMKDEELVGMHKKIQRIYIQEKTKANGLIVIKVEFLMRAAGVVHDLIDKRLFRSLKKHIFLRKNIYIKLLDKLQQRLYEFIQTGLDDLRLILRGLR